MASERDFELLDHYLANRLSKQEKASFEEQLRNDLSLQGEYNVQQKIVDGIRHARKAELKAMLNNIPVDAIPTQQPSNLLKVAGVTALLTLMGVGAYFYFASDADQLPLNDTGSQREIMIPQPSEETKPSAEAEAISPAQEAVAEESREPVAKPKAKTKAAPKTNLEVFDPSQELEEPSQASGETNIDKASPSNNSSLVVDTDNSSKKYNFHYQFANDKLVLYGAFEKNLYEILEFFTDEKRTVFLYYKANYYLLNEAGSKVKPLVPVNDPALLKRLREHRNQQQ